MVSLVSLACWIALTQSLGLVITDILPYLNDAEPGQLITYGDLSTELDPAPLQDTAGNHAHPQPLRKAFEVEPTIAFTTLSCAGDDRHDRSVRRWGRLLSSTTRVLWDRPDRSAHRSWANQDHRTPDEGSGRMAGPASPNQKWITERSNIVAIMAPPELPPADMTLETAHILTLTDLSARTETAAHAQIEQSAMKRSILLGTSHQCSLLERTGTPP